MEDPTPSPPPQSQPQDSGKQDLRKQVQVLKEENERLKYLKPPSDLVKAATSHLQLDKNTGHPLRDEKTGKVKHLQPPVDSLLKKAIKDSDVDEIALFLMSMQDDSHKVRMKMLSALLKAQCQNDDGVEPKAIEAYPCAPLVHPLDNFLKGFKAAPPPMQFVEIKVENADEVNKLKTQLEQTQKELDEAKKPHWCCA